MSLAMDSLGARQPVYPIQKPTNVQTQKEQAEDVEALREKRQSLQERLLLLKGGPSDAVSASDAEKILSKELESVTHQLQTAAPTAGGSAATPSFDRYEPESATPPPSAGLYHVEADETGAPAVVFDPPTDQEEPAAAPKPSAEKTTVNTDQVDREIERLKQERSEAEQALRAAGEDDAKSAQLERRLSQLDAELSSKDNDTYRKQHASVTQG